MLSAAAVDRQADVLPGVDRANGHRPTGDALRSAVMSSALTDLPTPSLNGSTPAAPAQPAGTDRPTAKHAAAEPDPVPTYLNVFTQVSIWALSIVVTFLAATGQVDFAEWASITDWRKYLVPAGLELAAIVLLLVGYIRGLRGRSPLPCWLGAAALGGFAVYTNVAHAGPRAGLLFGGFSAVALILWFVKLAYQYQDHRERTGQGSPPTPNFGALWLLNPRLAWRGLLVAKRLQLSKVEPALQLAEVWIAVFDDAKRAGVNGQRIKVRLRRRTAWRTVMASAGHPVADLPSHAEVQSVTVVDRAAAAVEPTVSVAPKRTTARRRPTARPKRQSARPTDRRPATRPTVDSPRTDSPTDRAPDVPTDSHSKAAVANARALRSRYGADLPTEYQVRKDTGWSLDRARPAIAAHVAGADLSTTPKETP